MKVFISWSGERSRSLAEALRQWLPGIINATEPWISSNDIDPGARWGAELARQLEQTKYGILCITAENVNAPWLLFEAGALSKYVNESRVVPVILDIKPTDTKGPLAQFQGIRATEPEIYKLVTRINKSVFEAGEKGLESSVLEQSFKLWWPQLKQSIANIPETIADVTKKERPEREIIEEILTLIRRIDNDRTSNYLFSPSDAELRWPASQHFVIGEDGTLKIESTSSPIDIDDLLKSINASGDIDSRLNFIAGELQKRSKSRDDASIDGYLDTSSPDEEE